MCVVALNNESQHVHNAVSTYNNSAANTVTQLKLIK